MLKWIGAFLGFMARGFVGAIIGLFIGSILDALFKNVQVSTGGGNFGNDKRVTPQDFELNLLSLASLVIKADGKVSQKELDYVRSYFVQAYGRERANATFRTFNNVVKEREVSAEKICAYIRPRLRYEVRLQVIHFLFNIANADGNLSQQEVDMINKIRSILRVSQQDFDSIKAMFFKSSDEAYKILEIDKDASNEEIKKAYRTMAKKYHPDKLHHMDEAYQKGAQEKFNKVQEAYEKLQKERGF